GAGDGEAPVAAALEEPAFDRRVLDDDRALGGLRRGGLLHACLVAAPSAASSSVGTAVMSPAPRQSTRSPGCAARASSVESAGRATCRTGAPAGNVAKRARASAPAIGASPAG